MTIPDEAPRCGAEHVLRMPHATADDLPFTCESEPHSGWHAETIDGVVIRWPNGAGDVTSLDEALTPTEAFWAAASALRDACHMPEADDPDFECDHPIHWSVMDHGHIVAIEGRLAAITHAALTAAAPHIRADWAADKAAEIRAELVCCDIYDQHAGTNKAGTEHAICFWGEAAARIVEGRGNAEDEVTPHLETFSSADLAMVEAATRWYPNPDISVELEPEETDEDRIRADERARALADVDQALGDQPRFDAWVDAADLNLPASMADILRAYLRETLGRDAPGLPGSTARAGDDHA